ncbi:MULTISPECIES: flagellar protein MotY [Pseudomonas]|uniref:OmpA/MotB domain protein n=1 Tax=Pseudomonas putida (strain W619) TaxID=390235 RepID=B1J4I3_PSEPW|nr:MULTISPECIES: OmpA family protein [Pseudomonas]MDH1572615.1 OmpA family protein [Pseudomonas sp. GD03746]QQE85173.1 OmpA family protein [Pseudomonas putida]UTL82250.1 OmpA family protein [Pseudomonas putida]HEN8709600.1 OmpA family protein [Pseudomonas putida]HEN8715144.1 OmpA family protein [Pseudomonas putida]
MRQRYLALLTLFASLPAGALTFQTRMENIAWKVEGDQFECRLIQPIDGFGSGEFVRRAGEQPVFQLRSGSNVLGAGSATLLAAAAPWQPGRGDINLGAVRLARNGVLFSSSQSQASRLINGLLDGRSTVVRSYTGEAGRPIEVRVLPVSFAKAWSDYQACAGKMLAMNYDQVRQTQVGFPGGGIDLDAAARARLDVILDYLQADPTVNHIELNGHSDNSGNRLTNRDTSRRRALAVADYLKAHGVPEEQITVRFHGERYPLAKNNSAANRARNRRVNIELDRVAPIEKPAAQPAQHPAPTTAPATVPAPGPASAAPVPSAAKSS